MINGGAVPDNSAGNAKLTAQIERMRKLPRVIVTESAPIIAKRLDAITRENIDAGRSPDGTAWPLTQAGKKPLQNAGKALSVFVDGTTIVQRITGPEALHHKGQVSGGIRRQIIPTRRVPDAMVQAIEETLGSTFQRTMGGP